MKKLGIKSKLAILFFLVIILTAQTINLRTQHLNRIRMCDEFSGSDAGAKIRACIADLPSSGGIADTRSLEGAQVSTATIDCSKPIKILLGGITLSSSGGTAFTLSNGCNIEGAGYLATKLILASGIDGISAGTGSIINGFTIQGPNSSSAGNSCIDSGSSDNIIIKHMKITLCGDMGINTGGGSNDWVIADNIFLDNQNNHIFVGTDSKRINITRNNFNTTSTTIGNNCVDLNGSYNIVSDNILRNCGREGGAVDDWAILNQSVVGGNASHNLISNNIITGSGAQAIMIRTANGQITSNVQIINNNISTSGQKTSGAGSCIQLDGSSTGILSAPIIANNTCTLNNQHGILINGASTAQIIGALILGNTSQSNTGTGLYITGALTSDTIVNDNISIGNGTNFDLSGSVHTFFNNNKFNFTTYGYGLGPEVSGGNLICLRDTTSGVNRICFDNAGLVGIGNSAPGKTLDVTGTGRFSGDVTINNSGSLIFAGILQANLGTPSNGTFTYCADCTIANPCAGGGGGAWAKRLGGAWICN